MEGKPDNGIQKSADSENICSTDYLHLIYLFYRHPAKAFKIVNSGRAVHGIVFFVLFVFILQFFYCIWCYYFSGIFYVFLSISSILTDAIHALRSALLVIIEYSLIFLIGAVILILLLRIMRYRFPVKQALSIVFYSGAISYPFILLVYILNIVSNYMIKTDFLFYLFLVPLALLEYIGFKDLLGTKPRLILAGVLITVAIQYLTLIPVYLYLQGVLSGIF
ncbi:MAG TPA: hypothetical protein ENN61_05120 [Bacteroidaceae bacterium]|nr:hypothetical protein [Bacteroidaceae bacterium]